MQAAYSVSLIVAAILLWFVIFVTTDEAGPFVSIIIDHERCACIVGLSLAVKPNQSRLACVIRAVYIVARITRNALVLDVHTMKLVE